VELDNMTSHHVWDYVSPTETIGAILPCKLFLKKKYSASGEFLKLKARLVAGGHRQGEDSLTSPTGRYIECASFLKSMHLPGSPAAYLNSKLNEDLYMRLPKSVSKILLKQQPQLQRFVQRSGSITVKLERSIYGLKQATADWYTEISKQLTSAEYRQSTHVSSTSQGMGCYQSFVLTSMTYTHSYPHSLTHSLTHSSYLNRLKKSVF